MYISKVKELAYDYKYCYKDDEIILTEQAVESFIMRLILIGLRLKGMTYKQSQQVVVSTYIRTKDALPTALRLLDKDKANEILKHNTIKELSDLFFSFSVVYRNKLSHGAIGGISDKRVIEVCIQINTNLIRETEAIIKSVMGHSAFDSPSTWGAGKSSRRFSDAEIDGLRIGGNTTKPIGVDVAIKRLDNLFAGSNDSKVLMRLMI